MEKVVPYLISYKEIFYFDHVMSSFSPLQSATMRQHTSATLFFWSRAPATTTLNRFLAGAPPPLLLPVIAAAMHAFFPLLDSARSPPSHLTPRSVGTTSSSRRPPSAARRGSHSAAPPISPAPPSLDPAGEFPARLSCPMHSPHHPHACSGCRCPPRQPSHHRPLCHPVCTTCGDDDGHVCTLPCWAVWAGQAVTR
jgi:hypothetical protein